ncbi:isoleucyl-tRNA synthetase [Exophiala aquamarina CBS 119918]|uniref:Isoleucine--tRNA ligase, mitochondrial n=1 Tax=Exophiala aquamarina CBS 119918 TaxID=1182545 RepID=A0A072PSB9_9EURO|nr:isoleucyl-tRNA synthetase [Exophiala aquamarina CBS 119918]KEF62223.1 isoleucyl-tRNA synthetase [Exophiala aquamarina CBS 119918]
MTQAAKDAARFLKSTLRLPRSKFPPRIPPADLAKLLPKCTDDLYAWQRRERPSSKPFVLHDGPPYANGDLHVGHALNKIVKDIICRSKLAEGRRVDYVPGWDCHGLPIELKALEHSGWERGQGVDPVKIRKAARKFAHKAVEKQMAGFRSWAVMGDWSNHWTTMQKDFEMRQLSVFQSMADHALIYRKHKPVYWSPSSGTALAEAELEYYDEHVSTAAFVKFPVDGLLPGIDVDQPVHLLIWTTTPWTIPANQAIAINTTLDYSLIDSPSHGHLLVASSRIPYVEGILGEVVKVLIDRFSVDLLLNATYSGLAEFGSDARNRPIYHADFVSAESGTGLVHCAPGHGMDDYEALQPLIKSGIVKVKAPVDNSGRFDETASPLQPTLLAGKDVFKAGNQSVLSMLASNQLLAHKHSFKHKYPIDWRTKEPVMIRATAQWFADISKIKSDTLKALDYVTFVPDTGETRLRTFVENRSEWCISRQRSWGVPIPAIYHKSTGLPVINQESIQHIIHTIENRGIDAWWSDAADDPNWIAPGLKPTDYIRGTDTMDVWFDSGTSWTSMLDPSAPGKAQADICVEGTDQHRGWFQSSLLTKVAYQKSMFPGVQAFAPFDTLATHGFTLDAQGKKMSKSLGNVIAPHEIIAGLESQAKVISSTTSKKQREVHSLGPDALRLWVASSDWSKDVVISQIVVKAIHASLDKYRVTMKLLLGLLEDFDLDMAVPYEELSVLDRIALVHLHRVSSTVQTAYPDFEFHKAVTAINRWVATDLSGFYFEGIKDIIYCDSPTSVRRRSAQTTLHHVLSHFQQMLGPITPLLVEESWAHTPENYKEKLEHPLKRIWAKPPLEWQGGELSELLPQITAINTGVKAAQEKARSEKLMGQSLASDVVIYLHPTVDLSQIPSETWKEIFVVSRVEFIFDGMYESKATTDAETGEASWSRQTNFEMPNGALSGIAVVKSPHSEKCARCWKYVVDPAKPKEVSSAGQKAELPLCERCTNTVAEIVK